MNNSIRIAAVALLLATSTSMSARDRSNARSMVITRYGIVATSHVQASVAGAKILERGGSAVDAAIAANAVLGVTEPMMNGMGGDLFAIYWEAKTGKLVWNFDTIPENAKRESLRRSDTLFLRRAVRQYTRQLECLAIQRPSA